jgi:hypothetical protein
MRKQRSWIEDVSPVCVTGMHRSGTSTITQLLYKCGLDLGDERNLFAAAPDNPDGFWEDKRFVQINEGIFKRYGRGWDLPPEFGPGWHKDERLDLLRADARLLIEEFDERHTQWGWKDPRNSLTMPFWMSLLPNLKVVLCLRHPLEVSHSLSQRSHSSQAFGFNLWTTYNQRLLSNLSEDQFIVTHFEAYFYRPLEEIRRVLDFLRLPASEQLVAQARSSTIKPLLHNSVSEEDVAKSEVTPEVHDLYRRLCQMAEWEDETIPKLEEVAKFRTAMR